MSRQARQIIRLLQWAACACAVLRAAGDGAPVGDNEVLIGWLGETYQRGRQPLGDAADPSGMRVVSWDPRIFHYRRFLSDEECDHLRSAAQSRVERSITYDTVTGKPLTNSVRTSSGMFFKRGEDAVVSAVEARVAAWTMLPAGNSEGMQVLRYNDGELYRPHHDYFTDDSRDRNGGNRMATVLMYLTDVEQGGETVFPHVPKLPQQTLENGWSNCSLQGLAIKPRKGDAVLFWSIRPDGTFDFKSLHGSCPVIKGQKWSATKWIHVAHYALGNEQPREVHNVVFAPPPPVPPAWCKDAASFCASYARAGMCITKQAFMVGTPARPGRCLASCGRCDVLPVPGQVEAAL